MTSACDARGGFFLALFTVSEEEALFLRLRKVGDPVFAKC
jgi:hypothetical protein